MIFSSPWRSRTWVIVLFAAFFAGCMGSIFNRYERMNFEAYINALSISDLGDAQSRWAYRVKSLPNPETLRESFRDWCQARAGVWHSNAKLVRSLGLVSSNSPTRTLPTPVGGMACVTKDTHQDQGSYVEFADKSVAFYTAEQLPALDAVVQRIYKEIQQKEDIERLRKETCRAQKTKLIRTQTRVGMDTLGGKVVEVKQGMVLLEIPSKTGTPTQYWSKIHYLEPPLGEYCD